MKLRNRLNWPLTVFALLLLASDALAAQTPTVLTVVVDAVAAAKTPLDALKAALAVFTEVPPDLAERAKTFDIDTVADYSLMRDVLADPSMKPFLGVCHS